LIRYYSQPSFGLFLQTPAAFVFASGSEAIYSTVLDSAVDRHAASQLAMTDYNWFER